MLSRTHVHVLTAEAEATILGKYGWYAAWEDPGAERVEYRVQGIDLYSSVLKYSRILDSLLVLCSPGSMKLSAYAKQLGISYQTAWRMWQRRELPAHQLPSGTVIVEMPPTLQAVGPQKVAVYARVSSAETRKNLDSQAVRVSAFCAARGWRVAKVVKECGSGVNDQRPRFLALLADASISHIVVEHEDRCSRFGVAYIQTLRAFPNRGR
jgi:predicted site-specific integrase-resolvase